MANEYPPLTEGDPESPVRVITYEDLQCKDCAWFRRKLDDVILPEFGGHVAFEHRDFPLVKHEWAREAAMAARHFSTVGYGTAIAFRRTILSEISIITKESLPEWVRDFATDYGADPEAAEAALTDARLEAVIDADVASGKERGIEKTPTVIVGNQSFVEWIQIEELSKAIELEVERKR